ncbi:MAG: sulfide/dihydroorotate dehydrogenase-like FAD/NAD-binding protein [Bacteroidales bacterium]|nr:sulfide/dihydroorotate dehydrogenase-like FAD/NAD-binding protein [Bacteroidales bacterium]
MYRIIKKSNLAPAIVMMEVEAPRVAKAAQPGQFVIVRAYSKAERIPLTIADIDKDRGTVTIVIQALGASTRLISSMEENEHFENFAGPLGKASELIHEDKETLLKKKIVFIAGGVGAAPIYPQVKFLHDIGCKPDVILGARNKEMIILEKELTSISNKLWVVTDDGSHGSKGLVTNKLQEITAMGATYDLAITIGPTIMMKFVAELTKQLGIKTIASLNAMMIDGTGMCGACRVSVGGKTRFTCVDGPEFDAHQINFDEAIRRLSMYKTQESEKLTGTVEKQHTCKIGRSK